MKFLFFFSFFGRKKLLLTRPKSWERQRITYEGGGGGEGEGGGGGGGGGEEKVAKKGEG